MLDPISILVGAICGAAIIAYPALRAVNRMTRASNEMLAVLKPLLAEVIAYRRREAAGEEDEIWQEEIEI